VLDEAPLLEMRLATECFSCVYAVAIVRPWSVAAGVLGFRKQETPLAWIAVCVANGGDASRDCEMRLRHAGMLGAVRLLKRRQKADVTCGSRTYAGSQCQFMLSCTTCAFMAVKHCLFWSTHAPCTDWASEAVAWCLHAWD
jgi:hypothetical protein